MNTTSVMTKNPAAQRLTPPLSAAWAPALIAPLIAVVLTPPMADTKASRPSKYFISWRTSWKKDIRLRRPHYSSRILDASGQPPAASSATDQFVLSCQFGAPGHFSATRRSGNQQQK